jgi:transcriptional regulator with XRE-family HTH domain
MDFDGRPHRVDLAAVDRAFFAKVIAGQYSAREDLARAIGRSRSTISRFFGGRNTSAQVVLAILAELDLTFDEVATRLTRDE